MGTYDFMDEKALPIVFLTFSFLSSNLPEIFDGDRFRLFINFCEKDGDRFIRGSDGVFGDRSSLSNKKSALKVEE